MAGEILRAVMDQSCAFSNPAFYNMESPPFAGGGPIITQVSYLETKVDRYFLMTGVAPQRLNSVGMFDNTGAKYQLRLLKSSRVIYREDTPNLLGGQDFNNGFSLPEYICIDPNETLELSVTAVTSGSNFIYSLTLFGLEYAR